jgi:DNA-3-methyladenine glycosylase II
VEEPVLCVNIEDSADQEAVEQALRATFVPAPPEFAELLRIDPVIADLDRRYRGLRPVLQFDLLAALVRSISAQQVNLRWAVTTRRRLAEAFGDRHEVGEHIVYSLNAGRLAATPAEEIRALQFTTRKAEYIIGVAKAIINGSLNFANLAQLPDEEIITQLSALRGIGRWTAEWILARSLGHPCVVAGDLGVRKAVGLAYMHTSLPGEREVRQATGHWGQSATIAQVLLLHSLSQGMDAIL